jgi:hypothetical protein
VTGTADSALQNGMTALQYGALTLRNGVAELGSPPDQANTLRRTRSSR